LKFTALLGAVAFACAAASPTDSLADALPSEADGNRSTSTLVDAITSGKSMSSFRLRDERVAQDGKQLDADALTLRTLLGWQTRPLHGFSLGAQLINVAVLNDDYENFNNGVVQAGKSNYPRVVDPDYSGINQLYLDWTGIEGTRLRAGRQSVKLDNVRFIGNVEFRQVMQVFDGISVENKRLLPATTLFAAQFNKVMQITTLQQDATVSIVNARHALSPTENLVGYGYFVDWNSAALSATSTQTLGLRLDGARPLPSDWKLQYTAEYAKQTPYADGASGIGSHYARLGAGAQYGHWFARLDQEVLSSNGSKAFQTPLGTNHLFQGWADLFLTTPTEGIRDTYVTAGSKHGEFALLGEYHWFQADRAFALATGGTGTHYGQEWDVSASWTRGPWMAKLEYARFREGDPYNGARKRDTDKVWVTGGYSF
jgi:hypothetical protein